MFGTMLGSDQVFITGACSLTDQKHDKKILALMHNVMRLAQCLQDELDIFFASLVAKQH